MAGLADAERPKFELRAGPFSALAREQYRALAAMRWSLFRNSLRSSQGAIELGARTIAFFFYGLMGLGMAAGFGAGAYALVASEKWEILPILFWVMFVLWQAVPVTLASFQEQFDLGGLLRFPVSFGAFYLLHVVFGLVDPSSIMGGLCCLGVWIGIAVARLDLFAWAGLSLIVFAAFNILLVRAISAWIDRWLAQRRTREIIGALFFLGLMSLQLFNPAFRSQHHRRISPAERAAGMQRLESANRVQRWFPPGLAAVAVQKSAVSQPAPALEATALLALFVLGTGAVLGMRLGAEYRGENLSDAPSRQKAEKRGGTWLIDGRGPMGAVMEKELRTLMRAMPLIYGLAAPLLMVFLLSGVFVRHGVTASHATPMSLLVSLAYAMVGFTQLFYNNLGPEGPAIQVLFLCPTPFRTVVLAKNLFHALLFSADAVVVCIIASLRLGWPSPMAWVATLSWLLFALPVHLAVGNIFSLTMPYRMNLGRITRQGRSQASALFSMMIQVGVLGLGEGILTLCAWFDRLWMAIPILLSLAGAAIIAWLLVLDHMNGMAMQRRESLIAKLVRTE